MKPKMAGRMKKYFSSVEDLEETLNIGFFKVFKKIETYKGRGSFEGWISAIMKNCSVDYLRAKKTNRVTEVTETLEAPKQYNIEESQFVQYVLSKLGDRPRRIFELYMEGCSHSEIAKIIGINEGTSKWHVHEAKKKLKSVIKSGS